MNVWKAVKDWWAEWLKMPPTHGTVVTGDDDPPSAAPASPAVIPSNVEGRFYGGTGTVHRTGEVNVELFEGKVVAVWYRCAMLPFTQTEVEEHRELSLRMGWDESEIPKIEGIVFAE